MTLRCPPRLLGTGCVVLGLVFAAAGLHGEPVVVRHPEGVAHGFLSLRAPGGAVLATGDLIQTARAGRVTTQVVFHFRDGSLHDETVVFSQSGRFRLIRDHLVQKGPAFAGSVDMSIDGASGKVHVVHAGDKGTKVYDEQLELPSDLANGLIPILLKNVSPGASPTTLSLVVATPRPRLVRLAIERAGRDRIRAGGASRPATHFVLKVEIGGLAGWLAPLVGKKPPDSHVWILEGQAPAFVASEQPLYLGGPLWRIEVTSPTLQAPADEVR